MACTFAKAEDQELLQASPCLTVPSSTQLNHQSCSTSQIRRQAVQETLGRHCILYFSALRLKLEDADEETTKSTLGPLLALEEDKTTALPTLLVWISEDIHFMRVTGWIQPPEAGSIEGEISQLNAFTAVTMKVHTQPFPLPYQQLMAFGLLIFTLSIPVPFVLDWHWYIAVPTAMSTMFLFGVEYLARRLSVCPYALPLISVCHA